MKVIKYNFLILIISSILSAQTDEFSRIDSILVPEIENCGFGEVISGVDFDNDGAIEIYAVNNMNDIGGNELIPRIYKYEYNGSEWELVWDETSRDIAQQNSWAPTTYGDWDQDGKFEIIWAPANNMSDEQPNPERILVWETGDNDRMGSANFGFDTPNADWTITDQDNFEVRPFRIILNDIDSDGDIELIFADREVNYRFGIISVSDIPLKDNESETWTLEYSGLGMELPEGSIYDMAIMNKVIYLFHSDGNVTMVNYENDQYQVIGTKANVIPGGSWKSSSTLDINKDGNEEIVISGWQRISGDVHNKIFLIEEDETDFFRISQIANFQELISADGRINGGHDAYGDVDGDGNIDMIFGTREATPAVSILRVEYQGGEISDSNSYQISVIDSLYPTPNPGRYDIINVSNLDNDPEDEILYTNGNTCERFPIVILDYNKPVSVNEDIIVDKFTLEQNYPNPFNPTTTISFAIPKRSSIELSIYNMIGEKVAILIENEILDKGYYSYKLNAGDLSSGMYIYKIDTDFGSLSKKLVLLK